MQYEQIRSAIEEKRNHRKLVEAMPVIRVTNNDPKQKHIRKVFEVIKEQNDQQRTEEQTFYNNKSKSRMERRTPKELDEFHKIDTSVLISMVAQRNKEESKRKGQESQKQIQNIIQKQISDFTTLKDINDQLFKSPSKYLRNKSGLWSSTNLERSKKSQERKSFGILSPINIQEFLQESKLQQSSRKTQSQQKFQQKNLQHLITKQSYLSEPLLLNETSMLSSTRTRENFSASKQVTNRDLYFDQLSQRSNNKDQFIDFLRQSSDFDQEQSFKIISLNDKKKLKYDKDSFLRFYKFKQSLQSQNILFQQLQEQQKLSKSGGFNTNIQQSLVENPQDFFVNVKQIDSQIQTRYIKLGCAMVFLGDQGYLIGGKQYSFQCKGPQRLKYDQEKQELIFEEQFGKKDVQLMHINQNPDVQFSIHDDIFNRYGHQAFKFYSKIIVLGGQPSSYENQSIVRPLCGDLVFYDPISEEQTFIQYKMPFLKIRAYSICIVGKYIYQLGGLSDRGQLMNKLIRINLCQDQRKVFKQKIINCVPGSKDLKEIPFRAYGRMCAIFYEYRTNYTEDDIQNFKFSQLSKEINWESAQNYIQKEGLYHFGGFDQESQPSNDLIFISIDGKSKKHTWTLLETKGKKPQPRYMHSFDYFAKNNVIILYGGRNDLQKSSQAENVLQDMHVLNLDSLSWTEVTFCSQRPQPRFNFSSQIIGSRLILLGGQNQFFKISHDYEIIELDQEVNFQKHVSKFLFKKMAAFFRASITKNKVVEEVQKKAQEPIKVETDEYSEKLKMRALEKLATRKMASTQFNSRQLSPIRAAMDFNHSFSKNSQFLDPTTPTPLRKNLSPNKIAKFDIDGKTPKAESEMNSPSQKMSFFNHRQHSLRKQE